MNVTYKLTY